MIYEVKMYYEQSEKETWPCRVKLVKMFDMKWRPNCKFLFDILCLCTCCTCNWRGGGCYILFTSSTCDGPGIMSVDSWTFTTQRMWNWTGYIVTEIKQNKDWRSGRPAKVSNPLSSTVRNKSPRKHSLTTPTWQTCYAVRITLMLYSHTIHLQNSYCLQMFSMKLWLAQG